MPFIYVTGSAGSGKTAVMQELVRLGHEAYDEDDPAIGSAHNKQTGKAVSVPPIDERTPQWFSEHEWRVFPEATQRLKDRSVGHIVFLCGNVATEQQLQELFDKVIFISIDEQTMRQRLAPREGNDFGKTEHEVQMILKRDTAAKALHQKNNSVIIDASKPLEDVVAKILQSIRA